MTTPPLLIALCGAPGSGKSEVQRILAEKFKVVAVDDGWPLRDFAMRHCGATKASVTTQEGKAAMFLFPGGCAMPMRSFLGSLGNSIEHLLGPDVIPEMALLAIDKAKGKKPPGYCFGSVRRRQGLVFKRRGGVVVEVVRKGCEPRNGFDLYDRSLVNFVIPNNGTIADLEREVCGVIAALVTP